MPELPEVEVICRGLAPHLSKRKICSLTYSGKNLRTQVPYQLMRKQLPNQIINDVRRRAKYIFMPLSHGDILIFHLGMTGKLGLFPKSSAPQLHDHLCILLDNDMELRFNDTRRFGSVHFFSQSEVPSIDTTLLKTTGPEPFSEVCSSDYLKKRAKGSTQAVKTFIMNGSIIAGVGNIYANESLFAAGIHPAKPAGKLTGKQWQLLITKIREILLWAIDCGGSTISDFLNASGQKGYFQANFRVYGRNGYPCLLCSSLLEKTVIGGRASFYCPKCQKYLKRSRR